MICPDCEKENASGGVFCIFCGSPLAGKDASKEEEPPMEEVTQPLAEQGEPVTIEEQVRSLQRSVAAIREDLMGLSYRLSAIERTLGLSPAAARSRPAATADVPPSRAAALPPRPPSAASQPPRRRVFDAIASWDWDWLIGGNWLARVGILTLVIGVGFFLKLAFDNDWIGETGRVVLGIVGGLALLGGGEFWQRKYPLWAQPLTGGGIAILYLSVFAAFALYDLIAPIPALGLFFLVTLAAAGLALKYESMTIAILGIVGGFITPVLFREQLPEQRLLLAYVLVLDLGVLGLASFRNWRWFTLLGLVGSLGLFWFWGDRLDPSLLLAQLGITFIFLIFMGATTLFHILWRKAPGPADQFLMVLNAAAYFGISYGLLFDVHRPWMGGFTLLLSLLYALLGYAVLIRSREHVYLSLFALGISVVFLTIAIPVQLGGPWISVAWAAEGAVLIWLSFTLRMPQLRLFGVGVFAVFAAYLLIIDMPNGLDSDFRPFLNEYMLAYALVIGITYLGAYLLYREKENLRPWELYLFPAFLVGGNLVLTITVPIQADGAWIAIAWAVEAVALIWLSFRLGLFELRFFGLGVFAIVVVRLLAFDTRDVELETFRPIINLRVLAFALGIASLSLAAYFLRRWRENLFDEREKFLIPALLGVANFLAIWILSAEIIAFVDSEVSKGNISRQVSADVKSLSLSILWAVYAAVGIVLGIIKRERYMRLAGLALLALPVVKLFVFDIFALEQGYRVGAFIGLGGILVLAGFLYQRYSRAIRGFLLE